MGSIFRESIGEAEPPECLQLLAPKRRNFYDEEGPRLERNYYKEYREKVWNWGTRE